MQPATGAKEHNALKDAYNRARHLPQRIAMMQTWADYCDSLRTDADVVPFRRPVRPA